MTSISSKSDRARLAKLDERVRTLDTGIMIARSELDDLTDRTIPALNARLASEEAKKPVESTEALDAAADTLLRDPGASTVTLLERITGSRRKGEDSLRKWRESVAPIKAAISKAEREIVKREREIADLERERDAAWTEFAVELYPALLAEAEARLLILHDEVLAPMRAIEDFTSPGRPRLAPIDIRAYWHETGNVHRDRTIIPRQEQRTYGGANKMTGSFPVDPAPYLDKLRADLKGSR